MENYEVELTINAPAYKVYDALTTQAGLESWWTTSCEVGTAVGEKISINFDTTYKVMVIEKLLPNMEVSWQVVDAHLDVPGLKHTNEWIGTHISFHLDSQQNAITRLKLEHIGLTPQIECYKICSQGWTQFLASLKDYVETGNGIPFVSA